MSLQGSLPNKAIPDLIFIIEGASNRKYAEQEHPRSGKK
jgi:hypothetical protein